jgi:hypothetical protein
MHHVSHHARSSATWIELNLYQEECGLDTPSRGAQRRCFVEKKRRVGDTPWRLRPAEGGRARSTRCAVFRQRLTQVRKADIDAHRCRANTHGRSPQSLRNWASGRSAGPASPAWSPTSTGGRRSTCPAPGLRRPRRPRVPGFGAQPAPGCRPPAADPAPRRRTRGGAGGTPRRRSRHDFVGGDSASTFSADGDRPPRRRAGRRPPLWKRSWTGARPIQSASAPGIGGVTGFVLVRWPCSPRVSLNPVRRVAALPLNVSPTRQESAGRRTDGLASSWSERPPRPGGVRVTRCDAVQRRATPHAIVDERIGDHQARHGSDHAELPTGLSSRLPHLAGPSATPTLPLHTT